ncbi:MAG: purine-binding chemotaxis protein CheW [Nitrospirae bacterium]|nr:purine-binding chemotaxis protein CheW [Nitrospirota bacterium]
MAKTTKKARNIKTNKTGKKTKKVDRERGEAFSAEPGSFSNPESAETMPIGATTIFEGDKDSVQKDGEGTSPDTRPSLGRGEEIENDPEKGQNESGGQVVELLGFLLGHEEYSIQVDQVKEIIRPIELTSIPRSSPILMGIISLRGIIIPLFNLKNRFVSLQSENGENRQEMADSLKRFVIIQTHRGSLGLLADKVTEVMKIKESHIKPSPPLLNKEGQVLIRGIVNFKERLVILLHTNRVIEVIEKEMEEAGRS